MPSYTAEQDLSENKKGKKIDFGGNWSNVTLLTSVTPVWHMPIRNLQISARIQPISLRFEALDSSKALLSSYQLWIAQKVWPLRFVPAWNFKFSYFFILKDVEAVDVVF